jgi:hypothetical protein
MSTQLHKGNAGGVRDNGALHEKNAPTQVCDLNSQGENAH